MNQITNSMYFIAIVCPPPVNEKLLQFKNWMKDQFGCIVALKSPAHITLIPPFWYIEEKEFRLQETLGSFISDPGEFDIRIDGFSHFGKRVLYVSVINNKMLEELKDQVGVHFHQQLGEFIKIDERSFHPHITIANRDMKPSHFDKAWTYFSKKEWKESFKAGPVSLLKLSQGKWEVIGGNQPGSS